MVDLLGAGRRHGRPGRRGPRRPRRGLGRAGGEGAGRRRLGGLRRLPLDRADARRDARGQPGGDPALGARLVEGYAARDRLGRARSGSRSRTRCTVLGYGRGSQTDMAGLPVGAASGVVREADGGEILLGARTSSGCSSTTAASPGAEVVDGVRRSAPDRRSRRRCWRPAASAATRSCARSYIHPLARDIPLRSNPYSTGDGLRLGAGGRRRLRQGGRGLLRAPGRRRACAARDPYELLELTFYHSEHGVLLNLRRPPLRRRDGRRPPEHARGARAAARRARCSSPTSACTTTG